MNNEEIRKAIKDNKLKYYQVADELGIHFTTFTVWLRHELPADKKVMVLSAIRSLCK